MRHEHPAHATRQEPAAAQGKGREVTPPLLRRPDARYRIIAAMVLLLASFLIGRYAFPYRPPVMMTDAQEAAYILRAIANGLEHSNPPDQ